MRYPEFIKDGDIIGITAPSSGIAKPEKQARLDNSILNLKKLGFDTRETKNVRKDIKGRSSSAEERAKEFLELWKNDDVKAIIMAAGGDFILEMLEYLDKDEILNSTPKWLQGYSDITGLSFIFTTCFDIATIYASNITGYGMRNLHQSLLDSIDIMRGKDVIQHSFEKHEHVNDIDIFTTYAEDPLQEYILDTNVEWKNLKGEEEICFKGRSIGGCLDVICNIIGTKYDKVKEYIQKYKQDGIIWFLEIFEMSTPKIFLTLWQMKNAGYFELCKGIIFGRPLIIREDYEISYKETIQDALRKFEHTNNF